MILSELIVRTLLSLNLVQDPCESMSVEGMYNTNDLVVIAKLDMEYGDSYFFKAQKVYKGRASNSFLVTSPDFVFKKDNEYLIFAGEIDDYQFSLETPDNECRWAMELTNVKEEIINYLNEKWVSDCYSQELEDSMKGKANSRELNPFCGCDGKTYVNFGHLLSSGITQYIPGECEDLAVER